MVCVHMHNLHVLSPGTLRKLVLPTRMLCCKARVMLSIAWCLVRRCTLQYKFSLSHELRRKSDDWSCRSFLFTDLEKNLSSPTLAKYDISTMDDISIFVTGGFHARSSGMRVFGLGTPASAPSLHPVGSPPPQSRGGQMLLRLRTRRDSLCSPPAVGRLLLGISYDTAGVLTPPLPCGL